MQFLSGCVITLSSYNQFHRDCQRDTVVIAFANGLTSLFSGCVVFAILGYMAHLQERTVQDVARHGPGLVFLTYPELVLSLPGSFIWAILFFAMLLVIF